MTWPKEYSPAEMISVCIAREIRDGDVLGQGISTPMVAIGYMLAKMTHAPRATISYTVGNSFSVSEFGLSLLYSEKNTIGKAIYCWDFCEAVSCIVPMGKITVEFFRPAQIDMFGNTNNVVIGDYNRPKVRLPGAAGIPDATVVWPRVQLYVPRHDPRVFVPELDFRSGLGYMEGQNDAERAALGIIGGGPEVVITDLCVLGFDKETRRMEVRTVHPGITLEEVMKSTGFELLVSKEIKETPPPKKEELDLIRRVIDPLGLARLETLPAGPERAQVIREIISAEFRACHG
ncbi:MAG: CoA-transferase subunit beta [Clostridia bacterium]|nr:CoA-transferase subunit beta [Clostridia bacterium]